MLAPTPETKWINAVALRLYARNWLQAAVAEAFLYDGCSLAGRKLPIWGGRDTLTEHMLNRLPDYIVKRRHAHPSPD